MDRISDDETEEVLFEIPSNDENVLVEYDGKNISITQELGIVPKICLPKEVLLPAFEKLLRLVSKNID